MPTDNAPLPSELIDDLLTGIEASTPTLDAESGVFRRLAKLALGALPADRAKSSRSELAILSLGLIYVGGRPECNPL
ncbi:MAG: hypothetical protein VYD08_05540 [Pseudomonadota bacterium]|nr:hypothetical protein [Pseudomonadota bacterium]